MSYSCTYPRARLSHPNLVATFTSMVRVFPIPLPFPLTHDLHVMYEYTHHLRVYYDDEQARRMSHVLPRPSNSSSTPSG